jgi:hypothetical protein
LALNESNDEQREGHPALPHPVDERHWPDTAVCRLLADERDGARRTN